MLNFQTFCSAMLTACCLLIPATDVGAQEAASGNTNASSHCPAFTTTTHYKASQSAKTANPDNWLEVINNAEPGDEILLEDGIYHYERYAIVIEKPLTLRGKSGNTDKVIIQGRGYGEPAEGLIVMADDVHIADLSIRDIHHHAITIQQNFARTIIYNVDLIDIGTQHIKGNLMGPDGLIACSRIGYQSATGTGDYNGGIDLHKAVNWVIRDNHIYNIFGDGSGCVVDTDCGTQYVGGGAAILIWRDSKDNIIERNVITGSFRGISLGLNSTYSGGAVRNNFIHRSGSGKHGVNGFIAADTGISLIGADNVLVEKNTVILAGDYPGAIEVMNATENTIRDNLISQPVWNRGDSTYNGCKSPGNVDCNQSDYRNAVIDNYIELTDNDNATTADDSADNEITQAALNPSDQTLQIESKPHKNAAEYQNAAEINPVQNVTSDELSSEALTAESLNRYENLLMQFRQERMLMMSERLKMQEERLQLREDEINRRERNVNQREERLKQALNVIQNSLNTDLPDK